MSSECFVPQVEPGHYKGARYDVTERFISYHRQIELIVSGEPEEVLEIGIGNGFVHCRVSSDSAARRGIWHSRREDCGSLYWYRYISFCAGQGLDDQMQATDTVCRPHGGEEGRQHLD